MRCKRNISIIAFFISIFIGLPAMAYNSKDAQYVTNSFNPAVLKYVICLQKKVAKMGKDLNIPLALDTAALKCNALELALPSSKNEPSADDIKGAIMDCGFKPGDGSPDMGCATK